MRSYAFLIGALLIFPRPAGADDINRAHVLGTAAVDTGHAVEYEVSIACGRCLNLTISSVLPGDAREIASGMCQAGRQMGFIDAWTIRVFLASGSSRPAAACKTR
jgi:hypothetical protein